MYPDKYRKCVQNKWGQNPAKMCCYEMFSPLISPGHLQIHHSSFIPLAKALLFSGVVEEGYWATMLSLQLYYKFIDLLPGRISNLRTPYIGSASWTNTVAILNEESSRKRICRWLQGKGRSTGGGEGKELHVQSLLGHPKFHSSKKFLF